MTILHGHAMTAQNQLDAIVERLCKGEPMDAKLINALMDIHQTAAFILENGAFMEQYTPQKVAAMTYRVRQHG